MRRRICAVTGSRAEYGLLSPLLKAIEEEPEFSLQLVVTGAHLAPEFGPTDREIEADGFVIDRRVETLLSGDTPAGVAKSLGLGVIGLADALDQLRPDLLLLLGDRYEILAAAEAALLARIPVAHIGGGDTTEGAFDEAIRHSITKMAHLHFVTNAASARRVRQLGEDPARVYNVGSLGVDRALALPCLDRAELERSLGFALRRRNLLVTFHPATLDREPAQGQFLQLLDALDALGDSFGLIFTGPNADPESKGLLRAAREFTDLHPNAVLFSSLGQLRYFSLIRQTDAVVGNSSSGIYEVPSFHKPTVNIGDRQKGRLFASSVLCCPPEKEAIQGAIRTALTLDCSGTVNPYGCGGCARRILEVLRSIPDYGSLLKKHFFDLEVGEV